MIKIGVWLPVEHMLVLGDRKKGSDLLRGQKSGGIQIDVGVAVGESRFETVEGSVAVLI